MPDDVETELYQHCVWLCENGYPVSWENIKGVAWQLGKICGMQGERGGEVGATRGLGRNVLAVIVSDPLTARP